MKTKILIMRTVGKNIRSIRESQNMSQEKLADGAGLHRTYIGLIERGQKNPTITTLYTISQALNVSIDILLKGLENVK